MSLEGPFAATVVAIGSALEVIGGMDSWFLNKVAGAVLAALLVAFGTGTLADLLIGHGDSSRKGKPGYELPMADAAPSGTAAPAAAAFNYSDIAPTLKTASAENGQAAFAPCRACHTVDKGGKSLVGPNLYGIVGREIASSDTFPRYSAAFKGQKGPWTFEKLANFLHNPRGTIPGNQMAFAGVKSNADLADLLVYLRSLSDAPAPLPN